MNDKPIRVVIVDDHTVVRKGLYALLSTPRFYINVIGEAADGLEAIEKVTALQPDVVLLDLIMPRQNGLNVITHIKANTPEVRILVLTSFTEDQNIITAIRNGAEGYLLKDCSPEELVDSIRSVYNGRFSLPADMARKAMRLDTEDSLDFPYHFTRREEDILRGIAQGMSNQDIADTLTISPHTVRSHVRSVMQKLNVNNRTQVALYVIESGLVNGRSSLFS